MKFNYFVEGSQSWLQVIREYAHIILRDKFKLISNLSYQSNDYVYLHDRHDAFLFLNACASKNIMYDLVEYQITSDNVIKTYPQFKLKPEEEFKYINQK